MSETMPLSEWGDIYTYWILYFGFEQVAPKHQQHITWINKHAAHGQARITG